MALAALYRWLYTKLVLDKLVHLFRTIFRLGSHTSDSYENIISRTCYYAWYVLTRRIDSNYPDVQKKVLNSEQVQNAVHEAAQDEYKKLYHHHNNNNLSENKDSEYQVLVEKQRQKAFGHMVRLRSCISASLMRIAGWILYRLLSRIFTSIQFNKSQMDRIRACAAQNQGRNIPVVYLPLHRSHLDYILISFILYMNNIKPPLVAAGDNLMIPFFGNLMRGLGAFFIKRRSESNQTQDQLYQTILRSYITENLREGNSLEFFVEGGRTRSGKVVMPKFGLLSIVVDALMQGAVEDVYIVPVSISYEKLIDGSFIDEQLGMSKKFENFGVASKAIWSTLHSNYGIVRVDFSKPFLLKEYLCQSMSNGNCTKTSNEVDGQTKSDFDMIYDCVACAGAISIDNASRSQVEHVFHHKLHVKETRRQCIESLARHVLFDAYKESALMSTHLVAFLLLTKYRRGVTLEQLANDLDWLRELLHREKGQSLSAFGDCDDLVRQALFYLGKELIVTEKVSMKWSSWRPSSPTARYSCKPYNRFKNSNAKLGQQRKNNSALWQPSEDLSEPQDQNSHVEIVYLKPVLKLQAALQLHYYSNSCVTLFHLESVLATSLFSFISVDVCSLIYDPTTYISNLAIDKTEFINRCKQICSMLQYEFYFTKTCQSLEQALALTFDSFVGKNIFVQTSRARGSHMRPESNYLSRSCSSSSSSGSSCLEVIEESLSEEEYENEEAESVLQSCTEEAGDRVASCVADTSKQSCEFRLLLTSRNCQLLDFYRSILAPYVESYWLTADRLAAFMASQPNSSPLIVQEAEFLKELTAHVQQMLLKGQIHYEESISYDTFRNSLKYLDSINAIRRIEQARRDKAAHGEANGCPPHQSSAPLAATNPSGSSPSHRAETSIYSLVDAAQMRSKVADAIKIYTRSRTPLETQSR